MRGTVTPAKTGKKGRFEEEEDDLTRDMENPTPEPNVTEVTSQGSKVTPAKGGNYLDLDEETTEKVEKTEPQVRRLVELNSLAVLESLKGLG